MVMAKRPDDSGAWMIPARLAKVCGGRVVRSGRPAEGLQSDSRAVQPGECFVALRGDKFDGHEFLGDAFHAGAAGAIVSQKVDRTSIPEGRFVIRVGDTHDAMLCIAAEHRRRSDVRVVGITGSCGKTSTKDMLGRVLSAGMPTVWSPRSFNNHIGVPLSLMQIRPDTRAAVIEIGTSGHGEIAGLTAVAEPDIGIVTCISEAHLKGLGSLEGVAKEKSSLLAGLREGGVAIVNGDDRLCRKMGEECGHRAVFVSVGREADWFATDVKFHGLGTHFKLQGERPVTLPRLGSHNVYNALLVIAAASELGMDLDTVLESLGEIPPSQRRLECHECGDVTVFDDTYNMNPDSSRAALAALAGLQRQGRKIVVFGEMLELGSRAETLHRDLGREVVESGVDLLVTVGEHARWIADGAEAHGLAKGAILQAQDVQGARQLLRERVASGDLVLCKASRRVGLDRLVDELVRDLQDDEPTASMPR